MFSISNPTRIEWKSIAIVTATRFCIVFLASRVTPGGLRYGPLNLLRENKDVFSAWDAETGEPVAFAHDEYTWSGGGISPNGEAAGSRGIAGTGDHLHAAHLEDDGHRAGVSFCLRNDGEFSYRRDWPATTSFSPDSTRFLVVYNDGTLIAWRIEPNERAMSEQIGSDGAFENCTSVALSHTGNQVFYASNDGTIHTKHLMGQHGRDSHNCRRPTCSG